MKKTPLRRKGGRLFPQSPEDKAYFEWFKKQRYPCDVCGMANLHLTQAAHLTKRGSGGRDRNNLVYLCVEHHNQQEGRTDAFIVECGKDLWATAQRHTARFDREGEMAF